jgi:hypothetical protein
MNTKTTPNTLLSELAAAARSYFQSTPELSGGLEAKLQAILAKIPTDAPYRHPVQMGALALAEARHLGPDAERAGQLYLLTMIFTALHRQAEALEHIAKDLASLATLAHH